VVYFKALYHHFTREINENTKNLNLYNRITERESNPRLPEHKSGVLSS